MELKRIAVVAVTMVLLGMVFSVIPVKAPNPTFKIGVIGPIGLPHWSPAGMKEASEMARDEINTAGGVNVGGTMYDIELAFASEHSIPTPDPKAAADEVENLITVQGAKFIIGGFRTEVVGAMINKSMDYKTPFFIDGASTDELISTTVRVDYAKFKYLFRVTPINSTMLFSTFLAFLKYYVLPKVLLPIYGDYLWPGATKKQVRVALLVEDLAWTSKAWDLLNKDSPYYPSVLGENANVTYSAKVPATETNFVPYMTSVIGSQARLMIDIFSGAAGIPLIGTWASMNVKALPVGINVMAQRDDYWTMTGGKCQYEVLMAFAGTRTPIVPGKTEVFWDNFYKKTNRWPIYTAWGAYDAIYGLKEAIEKAGTLNADALVPVLEATDRISLAGRFRYAKDHDVFMTPNELGPYHTGNVRAMMVQWQHARMEVVWPIYGFPPTVPPTPLIYARMVRLPPVMYPLITDINYDGKVDLDDVIMAALAFGSYPGHPRWRMEAELTGDNIIDIDDIIMLALDFGKFLPLPQP